MITFSLIRNPIAPLKDTVVEELSDDTTVNAFLARHGESVESPLICLVNGRPILRADGGWDSRLPQGAIVGLVPALGDPTTIIIWIIVIVVSVVVSLALSPSQAVTADNRIGETPAPDPTFDIRGQRNTTKTGSPIECLYGRVRHWPPYAAAPFNRFSGNDQYLYALFCCGHGEFDIDQVFIEDTPVESFDDVTVEIIQPGQPMTLFPDNVFTSAEVANIELFGPNQDDYSSWTPAFVACPPFERTTRIEVDLVLPGGLYFQDEGNLVSRTATVVVQARLIDDAGYAAGEWTNIVEFSKTMRTVTPQRFTRRATVAPGRYEVRARRTNNAELNFKGKSQIIFRALRAFLDSQVVYPGVTMLALKAKASNNLNDSASARVNFIGTRKLRVWDRVEQVWIDSVATRNPIWALCDIMTASYGGMLSDDFLALDDLSLLAETFDQDGRFFDWSFDQRTTVWEAAKTVLKVCRSVPILRGSQITAVNEAPQSLPLALFNENNIVADSFTYRMKMRDIDTHDGLEVRYLNPVTWNEETVLCLADGDLGERPKSVKLIGCTDRTRAYREGMYMRQCELLLRTNIVFRTGMEGHLPTYGQLVAISHDLPRWGLGGHVLDIDGDTVTLSRPVTFTAGDHFLLLRKRDGGVFGPVRCYQVVDGLSHVIHNKVRAEGSINSASFYWDGAGEPAMFLFGKTEGATKYARLATIAELSPTDTEVVEVTCLTYNEAVFAYDEASPPDEQNGFYIERPQPIPVVNDLEVFASPAEADLLIITWKTIEGVLRYVVETSLDGESFDVVQTTANSYALLRVTPSKLWIRVSATAVGTGRSSVWSGNVGVLLNQPNSVTGLTIEATWDETAFTASWTPVTAGPAIDGYCLRIFTSPIGGSFKMARKVFTDQSSFTYTLANAVEDSAVNRVVRVSVTAINVAAESATPAQVTVTNKIPPPPKARFVMVGVTGNSRTFKISWKGSGAQDLKHYRLWISGTNNFIPSANSLVYTGTNTTFMLTIPGDNHPTFGASGEFDGYSNWIGSATPARYFRVAEVDTWGTDFEIGAEHTIRAHNHEGKPYG